MRELRKEKHMWAICYSRCNQYQLVVIIRTGQPRAVMVTHSFWTTSPEKNKSEQFALSLLTIYVLYILDNLQENKQSCSAVPQPEDISMHLDCRKSKLFQLLNRLWACLTILSTSQAPIAVSDILNCVGNWVKPRHEWSQHILLMGTMTKFTIENGIPMLPGCSEILPKWIPRLWKEHGRSHPASTNQSHEKLASKPVHGASFLVVRNSPRPSSLRTGKVGSSCSWAWRRRRAHELYDSEG